MEFLAFKESVDILFEVWSLHRVTPKDDHTLSVNQAHMWDASDAEVLSCSALGGLDVVVLDVRPLFRFHVLSHGRSIAVDRQSDQTNTVAPIFPSGFKHGLVVGHRPLARGTPSGPKVKQ